MYMMHTGHEFYRREVKKWVPDHKKHYLEAKYSVGFIRSCNNGYRDPGMWIESHLPMSKGLALLLDIELSEYILDF
jgi:hypothetical protein